VRRKESAKISVLNPRQSAREKKYFSQMGAEKESAKISVLNPRQSARDKNAFLADARRCFRSVRRKESAKISVLNPRQSARDNLRPLHIITLIKIPSV
jgi:hypothetical protein